MKGSRGRLALVLSLICNLLIVVFTSYSVYSLVNGTGLGNMQKGGYGCFRYFTIDSNVFCGAVSLLMLLTEIVLSARNRVLIPKFLLALKLMAATAVMVTFTVCVAWLGPMSGFSSIFSGVNVFLHMIVPIMAMVSFCLFERNPGLRFSSVFLSLLPVTAYGIVYLVQVVIRTPVKGGWSDFYMLNSAARWYISFPVILGLTLILSMIQYGINRIFSKRR